MANNDADPVNYDIDIDLISSSPNHIWIWPSLPISFKYIVLTCLMAAFVADYHTDEQCLECERRTHHT